MRPSWFTEKLSWWYLRNSLAQVYKYDTGPNANWSSIPMKPMLVAKVSSAISAVPIWAKLPFEKRRSAFSPAVGQPKWNWEALNRLLSNKKYTRGVLPQGTTSVGGSQFENSDFNIRYLILDIHETIISDETFITVQKKQIHQINNSEGVHTTQNIFLIEAKKANAL